MTKALIWILYCTGGGEKKVPGAKDGLFLLYLDLTEQKGASSTTVQCFSSGVSDKNNHIVQKQHQKRPCQRKPFKYKDNKHNSQIAAIPLLFSVTFHPSLSNTEVVSPRTSFLSRATRSKVLWLSLGNDWW